jgi:hypothetical protein
MLEGPLKMQRPSFPFSVLGCHVTGQICMKVHWDLAGGRGKVKVGDAICIIDETKSREQAGI